MKASALVIVALALVPPTAGAAHAGAATPEPPVWAGAGAAGASSRGNLGDSAAARAAAGADGASGHKSQARELWRAHRNELDLDPNGELVVRDEIVVLVPANSALSAAADAGFTVRRRQSLDELDATVVVLTPPHGLSTRKALKRLRAADAEGNYDYNHIYLQAAAASPPPTPEATTARSTSDRIGSIVPRVGLIDGGVEAGHAALQGLIIHAHGCGERRVPSPHGTAVASLLLPANGSHERTSGSVQVYAADVYCGAPTGGSADALGEALAWMAAQHVPVINVSLVGPANAMLERLIHKMTERGHVIVAAVGNDGPAAPPMYPAAYAGVVAVTGVDRNDKALFEAARGPYVRFAAPGANILAARLPDGLREVRGTSYASPQVAALLAAKLERPDRELAAQALHELEGQALHLGAPGVDPVYGFGCLGCRPVARAADSRGSR